MTILLPLIFGVALFCLVAASLGSYVRRQTARGECTGFLASVNESVIPSGGGMRFAPRETHLPQMPDLSVHQPFDTASFLPRPVLEPVTIGWKTELLPRNEPPGRHSVFDKLILSAARRPAPFDDRPHSPVGSLGADCQTS